MELITGDIIYDWKMFARFDIAKDSINRSIKVLVNYIYRRIDLHLLESSYFHNIMLAYFMGIEPSRTLLGIREYFQKHLNIRRIKLGTLSMLK